VHVLERLCRFPAAHIVGRAYDEGCAEVSHPPRCFRKVRVVANVDSEAQTIDLEHMAIAPDVETVFAAKQPDLVTASSIENVFSAKEVRFAIATDEGREPFEPFVHSADRQFTPGSLVIRITPACDSERWTRMRTQ
jgi:hypothetical protein